MITTIGLKLECQACGGALTEARTVDKGSVVICGSCGRGLGRPADVHADAIALLTDAFAAMKGRTNIVSLEN